MPMLKKKLLKYRIKLLLSYIKTIILSEFVYLWVFSPAFAGYCLSKMLVLGWVFGIQCFIMVYFNIKLMSENNFIILKWLKKLETERNELRYAILEEKNLIQEVGNIKILPFRKH